MKNAVIEERIATFKADLVDGALEQIFHKHLLASRSPVLKPEQERDIVFEISRSFAAPVTSVFLVGSAKLGFRMLPKDADTGNEIPARPQFSLFDDFSDIDVAIISQTVFLSYWNRAQDYYTQGGYQHFTRWDKTEPARAFAYYLMHGWIRPDALPATQNYDLRGEWFAKVDTVNALRIANAKVKVGLYFDPKFLTNYQVHSLRKCKSMIEATK
jgi:hypothetical protein